MPLREAFAAIIQSSDDKTLDGLLDAVRRDDASRRRSESEAQLHIAALLGLRIRPGGLDAYPAQENVEVREEDGHLYIHTRSVQPAGPAAQMLYAMLLDAVQKGYTLSIPQPDPVRTVRRARPL